jgi:hypothetical protein
VTESWRFEFLFDLHSTDGEWVYKRDPRVRLPWQRAVHTVAGVEYLRPEIALLFKAKNDRPKEEGDMTTNVPEPAGEGSDVFGHEQGGTDEFGQETGGTDEFGSESGGTDEFGQEPGGTDEFGQETGGTDVFSPPKP